MITCKYCGQELQFLGEHEKEHHFHCSFCDLVFPLNETSNNRKRKMSVPEYLEDAEIYQPVQSLLKLDTITLFFLLKDIRSFWYNIKTILENAKVHYAANELPSPTNENENDDKADKLMKETKKDFIELTKRKFVVENIILERTGFLPDKITEEFLGTICQQGRNASSKPMYVYIK